MSKVASLLAVFAHPDDEAFSSGGTLAHYAALGARVVVACATRGEAGQIKDPALQGVSDLGKVREEELARACAALGLEPPVFLGFRDSGRNERLRKDDPMATINADLWEIERRIKEVIALVKPQVMITFDPHGGYLHPDHLVIHRAATAAFFSSGYLEGAPERLFYTAWSLEMVERMQALRPSLVAGLEPQMVGVSESTLAVRMAIADQAEKKRAAIRAHSSQTADQNMSDLPPESQAFMERMFSYETFALGGVRGPVPRWPLEHLFDGLDVRLG
jgi:LmbE family N-acetylglucosaminyl deacetylase